MPVWTVTFSDTSEMMKIRADKARRERHIAYMRAHPEIRVADGLRVVPKQDFNGAIWTVEADSRRAVERLIQKDPYYVPSIRSYRIEETARSTDVMASLKQ
ncbi:MAG: hypothetical protein MRY77_09805 [Rhodobacteraceae bacterium]|nr:hypothetical protein [Paracoccaceae bacterium]